MKYDHSEEIGLAVQLCRAGARRRSPMTPVFLHFSDIHNSAEHFSSVMELYNENKELITDVILTGDIVNLRFAEGLDPQISEHLQTVLSVVGNHDMHGDETGWDWTKKVSEPELFELLFKKRADGHELAIEHGRTYWYRDYDRYSLRLVGLNAILKDDAEQITWLTSALGDAKAKGYCVIIAEHFPPLHPRAVPCNFSSVTVSPEELPGGALSEHVQDAVAKFKADGGEFICYLCGHVHVDCLLVNEKYPDQLFVAVDTANPKQAISWSDTYRLKNTRSEELYNLFSYDTERKLLKIVRVGANADCLLRSKRSLCINYLTGEIISQS